MRGIKILIFTLLIFQGFFAQQRTCGMDRVLEAVMKDSHLRKQYFAQQEKFNKELEKLNYAKGLTNNITIRIPVAVHFPNAVSASTSLKNCLIESVQKQIDIMNKDYNAINTDISNWDMDKGYYPGVSALGNLNIEFKLATKNHPVGMEILEGEPAVTFGYNFGKGIKEGYPIYDVKWKGYLNIVVKSITDLGYSPIGGLPSDGGGVVIDNNSFSAINCSGYMPEAPYNLGRTLTHELGHYFNLLHTFGNENGCDVSNTDFIDDTPKIKVANYGCHFGGEIPGCEAGEFALVMNYMDYSNDACMYMFTYGQEQRMRAYHNIIASEFKQDVFINDLRNTFVLCTSLDYNSYTIKFIELTENYSVALYDVTGKRLFEELVNQDSGLEHTINLEDKSTGIYFLNVTINGKATVKKIVKY